MIIIYHHLPKEDLEEELRHFAAANQMSWDRGYLRFLLTWRPHLDLMSSCKGQEQVEEHQGQLLRRPAGSPGGQIGGAEVRAETLYHRCSPQLLARAHHQRKAEDTRRHPAGR